MQNKESRFSKEQLAAYGLLGAAAGVAVMEQPASAAAGDGVTEVNATVTSLGGIATAALTVALVPFGIFYAVKIVRRVMAA